MSFHSDLATNDVPDQLETEPGPDDMPTREELRQRTATSIPAVRPLSTKAVAAMLADVFQGVPGFRLVTTPQRLERAFGSEGRGR